MDATTEVKAIAKKIIAVASSDSFGSALWSEKLVPTAEGFNDRAGFIVDGDIECSADVIKAEDGVYLLRARLGKVVNENGAEKFFIITLDFAVNSSAAQEIINNRQTLAAASLETLLDNEETVPYLLVVNDGQGSRREYKAEEFEGLAKEQKQRFVELLQQTLSAVVPSYPLS